MYVYIYVVIHILNSRILFLKILKLLEFLILRSNLFHSIIVDGKKEFLEKVCLVLKKGILCIFVVT